MLTTIAVIGGVAYGLYKIFGDSDTPYTPPRPSAPVFPSRQRTRFPQQTQTPKPLYTPQKPRFGVPSAEKQGTRKFFPNIATPIERDNRLRVFPVVTPEGEVHNVDPSAADSIFYGPVWTRILDAYEKGDFIRGRAVLRRISSSEDRFSGYSVSIDGVEAFLPASRAAHFYHPEFDATRKCVALKVKNVYPNGPRQGTVIVDAYAPLKYILANQKKADYRFDATPFALAMDYDSENLLFPLFGDRLMRAPLREAMSIAARKGIDPSPDMLTGYFWQVRITDADSDSPMAEALDILA